jgi:hypothetical protein
LVAAADEPGLNARTGPAEALVRGKSAAAISAIEASIDRHGQDISCLVLALGPRPVAGAAIRFRRPAERSRSRLPGPSGVLMVFSSGRALLEGGHGRLPTSPTATCVGPGVSQPSRVSHVRRRCQGVFNPLSITRPPLASHRLRVSPAYASHFIVQAGGLTADNHRRSASRRRIAVQ